MDKLSPMLQQYRRIKNEVGDALLFFRLGDFYELFFDDAALVAQELDLVLTSRAAGNNQKAPMCGVPFHAVDSYINRLVKKGYKVAIADQMEEPTGKTLVDRAVTQIITSGTNLNVEENKQERLAAVQSDLFTYSICLYDLSTNQQEDVVIEKNFVGLIQKLLFESVVEVITDDVDLVLAGKQNGKLTWTQFTTDRVAVTAPLRAQALIMDYLAYTQKQAIQPDKKKPVDKTMTLDYQTIVNLELFSTQKTKQEEHSLFHYLNRTQTKAGSRTLSQWLKKPLIDREQILHRQALVGHLVSHRLLTHQVKDKLSQMTDLERLVTRLSYGKASLFDLIKIKKGIQAGLALADLLKDEPGFDFVAGFDLQKVVDRLENTIHPDVESQAKNGQQVQEGVDPKLDSLRYDLSHYQEWLLAYEEEERQKTGIKNLKIGYSRAFGYYIEVSKGQVDQVKPEFGYLRRQTLTGAQRYISEALAQKQDHILTGQYRVKEAEERIIFDLMTFCLQHKDKIIRMADAISRLDALFALSQVSDQPGFVAPTFNDHKTICVRSSIHPILAQTLKDHQIVDNDILMDESHDITILTGPNMGGKSTYMRQLASLVLMAQMGSYVWAKECDLPIFTQIFTRMGASDDILFGQSTFMVEMLEANTALSKADGQSLILFDEIGRGTSTYDGMALAYGILAYLATKIKAKTIFATHYHELAQMAKAYPNIHNAQVEVVDRDGRINFMYRVIEGCADRSYGIHVAKLAGLPDEVVAFAHHRLEEITTGSSLPIANVPSERFINPRESRLYEALEQIDPNQVTPLEALVLLNKLKKELD